MREVAIKTPDHAKRILAEIDEPTLINDILEKFTTEEKKWVQPTLDEMSRRGLIHRSIKKVDGIDMICYQRDDKDVTIVKRKVQMTV